MKVAILIGKYPSGGGVATYLNEFIKSTKEFIPNVELSYYVFNTSVLRMNDPKHKDHTWDDFKIIERTKESIDELNSNDYIFCLYHVCYKQVSEKEVSDYFDMIHYDITTHKIFFLNEHSPRSIKYNYGEQYALDKDFLLSLNNIVMFGNNTSSAKMIRSILEDEEYNKRYVQMLHPFHFGDKSNWVSASDKIKSNVFLGRYVGLKDPQRLIRAKEYFDKYNFILEMYGITASIALVGVPDFKYKFVDGVQTKEKSEKTKWINKGWLKEHNLTIDDSTINIPYEERENRIFINGSYNKDTIYNNIRKSAFASDFFNLKSTDDYAGHCVEYVLFEFIDNGIIPILDSEVGEHCYLFENGKLSDKKFNTLDIAIYINKDLSNIEEAISKMNELYNNPEKYEEFRNNCYENLKKHTDPKQVITKFFNDIKG